MKLSRHIVLFSIFISFFILFFSWIMNSQVFRNKYPTVHSSQSSNFKINHKPVSLSLLFKEKIPELQNEKTESFTRDTFYKCNSSDCIVLAVVCCGDRANETYTMIKSAITLSHSQLLIELFTVEDLFPFFKSKESGWSESIKRRVKLNLRLANYPPGFDDKTWRNLFRTCASIRLFLPSLLSEVDSLIYVDTDVVFLATLESLWSHMGRMNSSHMAGLSPEHEDAATGWYNRFAKHPYYGRLGVNSGVMLMNLTRLRAFGWEEYLVPIEKEFHAKLSWGDQDIINIIFHYHPDKLYLFGCQFNYRPDHCMYTSTCKDVADTGVFALHGSRRTFHTEKQPVFKAVYETWSKFELGSDLRQDFYYPVSRYFFKNATKSNCGKLHKAFLRNIEGLIVL